ncbi:MAG: SDR family NAD(P)-dependent oxidoreductase [Acidobacteriota bacterium]
MRAKVPVALVTGASQGIGRAIALELARRGHPLGVSARSADALTALVSEVDDRGGRAIALPADLTDRADSKGLVARCTEELGAPLVLVHAAGLAPSSGLQDTSDEDWDRALELNAFAAFALARAATPGMIDAGFGRVVVIASTAGRMGYAFTSAYTASKHAAVGLVRALALELARTAVTVNAVCPGFTETAIVTDAITDIARRSDGDEAKARKKLEALSPQRRFVQPEEVAAMVGYLVGEDAGSITGQALGIDGGAVCS